MIIFVQPEEDSNVTYLVDVGFGGFGLTRPILLSEDSVIFGTTPTEQHRLARRARDDSSLRKPAIIYLPITVTEKNCRVSAAQPFRIER